MTRALHNVQILIPRLKALGYRFGSVQNGEFRRHLPYRPPVRNLSNQVARLEKLAGPIPLSLKAFYEVVGGINLVGAAPFLVDLALAERHILPDALAVDSVELGLYSVREWKEIYDGNEPEEPCAIWIAADEYHKDDTSGGPPYSINVPNAAADAWVENEWHETMFVSYLRESFSCAGFPGLRRCAGGLPRMVKRLSEGLVPL